jgi:hypothetical protein
MEAQHMAWPPDERPHYDRMLAILPDAMGAAEFERARTAGRGMTPTAVFAVAVGGPPDE